MAAARDVRWTHNSPENYDLLVNQRHWPAQRYRDWFVDSVGALLLAPPPSD